MRELLSSGQFKSELANVYKYTKEVGPRVQNLLEDAFLQAMPVAEGGHGSTARLSLIVQMAEHVKVINTKKLQNYIKAHADVKWSKNDDGSHSFKFRDKPAVTLPEYPWFEHKDNTHKAVVDVDIVKEIKRLLNKAAKEGAVVKDDKNLLPALRDVAIKNGVQWQAVERKAAGGKHTKHRQPA